MADKTVIPTKDLENLKEQLSKMPKDKDRIRLVTTAAESFNFTCGQLKQLIDLQHYGEAKNKTAILLYPKVTDSENFDKVLQACYKFEEDKTEIKAALGLK